MKINLQRSWAVAILICVGFTANISAEHHKQHKAIEAAVQNYVSAIYEMKPELIDKSVSPKLQKLGYMPARDGSGLKPDWMNHTQLKELAATINKDKMFDPATSPRKVKVLHNTDMIANVKLDAGWGIDYIHLTKESGEWMIINVIWEMPSQ